MGDTLKPNRIFAGLAALAAMTVVPVARAQEPAAAMNAATTAPQAPSREEHRWSADLGLGIEPTFKGKVTSGSIGTIQGQAAVVLPNKYGDVYGTGFQFRFGGGYMLSDTTEARGMFTYQSMGADLVPMGDIGISRVYAQFDKYRSFALDVGLRRYFDKQGMVRPYAEGSVGIGWISDINAELSAPGANVNRYNAAFFHSTTALAWAVNAGLLWQAWDRAGFYAQFGMRYTSGLSTNDVGGLPGVTDGTSRWSVPIVIGVRYTVR
jgi:hypothetical protein